MNLWTIAAGVFLGLLGVILAVCLPCVALLLVAAAAEERRAAREAMRRGARDVLDQRRAVRWREALARELESGRDDSPPTHPLGWRVVGGWSDGAWRALSPDDCTTHRYDPERLAWVPA